MTERRSRLEERLAALRPSGREAVAGARLSGARRVPFRPSAARLIAVRWPAADPLSGHRGVADGVQVAARLGDLLLACELVLEHGGPCLRGQLVPPPGAPAELLEGALVHVRTAAGPMLASVDPGGEFVVPRLPSDRLVGLDVETEDGAWTLTWPGEDAS